MHFLVIFLIFAISTYRFLRHPLPMPKSENHQRQPVCCLWMDRFVTRTHIYYILSAYVCVRVLLNNVTALWHLNNGRSSRICAGTLRYRYSGHQTCRLEVHNLCHWFVIHFHNFSNLGAKLLQKFGIHKSFMENFKFI